MLRVGSKPPEPPRAVAPTRTGTTAKPQAAPARASQAPAKSTKDVFQKQQGPSHLESMLGKKELGVVHGQPGGWAEYGLVRAKDKKPVLVFAQERVTVEGRFPDKHYDGRFIGAESAYGPGTRLTDMRGVRPDNGSVVHKDKIVFVNGILTSRESHEKTLKAISNKGGAEVIGLYNASEGLKKDGLQTYKDKFGMGENPATATLARLIYNELKNGNDPIHIMAHSQAGALTSEGLRRGKKMLENGGMSRAEAERRLSRVYVETFGSAADHYPKGARYQHYVSRLDPVPHLVGSTPWSGKDVEVTRFLSLKGKPLQHYFEEVYLPHWKPSPDDRLLK